MKKLLLVLVVAICLVALCACGEKAPEKEPEKEPVVVTPVSSGETTQEVVEPVEESGEQLNESGEEVHYSEDLPDADTIIHDLMTSEEYQKKSDKDKKVAVENMLNELVARKEIKNLSYDESEQLYSFEYKNGSLGGVSLKTFDDKIN